MSRFAIETVNTADAAGLHASAAAIADVHEAAGQRPWSAQGYLRLLQAPATLALVARSDWDIVGFIVAQRALDEAEVLMIAVAPETQRHGVGRQLLYALHELLAASGVTRIMLDVAEDNVAALSLYRRTGYLPIGRRKDYYGAAGSRRGAMDALVLARELGERTA